MLSYFEFTNLTINFESSPEVLNVKKLKIYPKLLSIYNNKNFQSNKIVLNKSNIIFGTLDFKFIVKEFLTKKNKLYFDDLNIRFYDETNLLASLENIKFTNFGFKKDIVNGNIFGKEFKAKVNKSLNKINFKIHKAGVNVDISLDEKKDNNSINGVFKSKILNTNLKFNFIYDEKSFNIYNSFFRSKNLSFENNNLIIFEPFLDIKSNFKIDDVEVKIFNKFKIEKLLTYKNLLKQINSKNEINFNSKKFNRNFIDKLDLKFDLAYGRLNYSKKIFFSDNILNCKGSINLLEEFPLLFFDCLINSNTKRDFFKKFDIDIKKENNIFNLSVKGNLSIINNKINFKEITMNNNYKASNADLNYFKEKFENILFEDNFIKIFNLKKIKEFILEIS